MGIYIFERRKIDIIDSLTEFLIKNDDKNNLVDVYNSWSRTFYKEELPNIDEVQFTISTIQKLLR